MLLAATALVLLGIVLAAARPVGWLITMPGFVMLWADGSVPWWSAAVWLVAASVSFGAEIRQAQRVSGYDLVPLPELPASAYAADSEPVADDEPWWRMHPHGEQPR